MTRLLLAFLLASQDTPPEKCSVAGTVFDAATGDPLGRVELLLEPLDRQAAQTAATQSDSEGRFCLVDVNPGNYRLKGQRNGFLETYYGARRSRVQGSILNVEAGRPLDGLKLRLVPPAVVAGTVRGSDGEPLVDAIVEIARMSYEGGRRHIDVFDSTDTNDLGQYRFHRLPPGTYYLSARPRSGAWKVDHSPDARQGVEVPVHTYYPGVREAALATPVEVGAGGRATGIDIALIRTHGFRVSGRVMGTAEQRALSVTLRTREGAFPDSDVEYRTTTRNAAGEFDLLDVPPGSYVLSISDSPGQFGGTLVEVNGGDVDGLRVAMGPFVQVEVKGSILTEPESQSRPNVSEVFLTEDGRSGQSGSVAQDNTFTVRNLIPGRYLVRLSGGGFQRQFYIKSLRSGDADVLQSGLQVTEAGAPPLEILLASDGGAIEGAVLHEEQRPLEGAAVVLVPDPPRRAREDLFKHATTDLNGRYQFTAPAPGEYVLFAWYDVEPDSWLDPSFLKEFEKYGEPVTVRPDSPQIRNLKVIPER